MKNNTFFLLLFVFAFFACNDDDNAFHPLKEGLDIKFTPVAGGAMMHYNLPDDSDIFAMNIRYKNWQGMDVLKTCGYSGDSVLLDGFTRKQESITALISFVNQRDEESEALEYSFSTLDSAPWVILDSLKVRPSWNGFQVIYDGPAVATGMAHVFYLGTNPLTQQEDTILMSSFAISSRKDTLSFVQKQERASNTIIIRTEDFHGYRVRQEVYPDIDAFRVEKWSMTAENFNDFGLSVENETAMTGISYLFDGELKGLKRLEASAHTDPLLRNGTFEYATYVAGPRSYGKPMVLDLREPKTPAWVRLYCLYPLQAKHPVAGVALGEVWNGSYEDKLPCNVSIYGHPSSSDPNAEGWVYLGRLNQAPERDMAKDRWCALTRDVESAPKDATELEAQTPIYVDIQLPPVNNTYRYLKMIVNDTFDAVGENDIDLNEDEYFTLHELEVYVKKN